jgi:hypothetical protein
MVTLSRRRRASSFSEKRAKARFFAASAAQNDTLPVGFYDLTFNRQVPLAEADS